MARTTFICKCKGISHTRPIIEEILQKEGYNLILENDEYVWKCGNGQLIPLKFIKFEFADDTTVHISGWVKSNILPEQNLDGYINGFPKKQVQKVILKIQNAIR